MDLFSFMAVILPRLFLVFIEFHLILSLAAPYEVDVLPEACREKHSDFCNSQVENSVCNVDKNECFCKKGYVVIKERNTNVCKPLLTDLPCRVDKDCVHVSGSICHPGAGQCVCPSKHVFVAQLLLCRRKYEYPSSQNLLCRMCRDNKGECFLYDPKDTRVSGFKSGETVGCACSGNSATFALESIVPSNICNAKLVDIGQMCNHRDMLCRSMKSSCVRINNLMNTCQCLDGYVAVYQNNLNYHECFPVLNEDIVPSQCGPCIRANGKCYDTNNSKRPDGCICPVGFSSTHNGQEALSNPCTIKHLTTTCIEDKLKFCFLPFNNPPFGNLIMQLRAKRANIFIRHPTETSSERRYKLTFQSQTVNEQTHFCGLFVMTDQSAFFTFKPLEPNKVEVNGVFEIIRDSADNIPDISIPFSCIKEGGILPTAKNLPNSNNQPVDSVLQLELRVLDSVKSMEIVTIYKDTFIALDVTLIDSKGFYTDMEIEMCFFSNSSSPHALNFDSLLYERCSNSSAKSHVEWKQIFPGIHYQTTPFILNRETTWQGDVFIHCHISLCRSQQSCQQRVCNKSSTKSVYRTLYYRHSKIRFLDRHQVSEGVSGVKDDSCPYSLCLNQVQAVMTSSLLLLLLLLVIILLLILFKRQRMLQRLAVSKKAHSQAIGCYKANSDIISGNNQNFYLLTDTNSISNSADNIDISDISIPLRDSNLLSTLDRSNVQYNLPSYHRSVPHFDNGNYVLSPFQTISCSKIKPVGPIKINKPNVPLNDTVPQTPDALLKINNFDDHKQMKPDSKSNQSTQKCSEMICMCND